MIQQVPTSLSGRIASLLRFPGPLPEARPSGDVVETGTPAEELRLMSPPSRRTAPEAPSEKRTLRDTTGPQVAGIVVGAAVGLAIAAVKALSGRR